jgi:tRNA dimethylallyltransferase
VYRYLDIGTAKPTPQELSSVPHHLIDIINPDDEFSLATYQERAYQAIEEIYRRDKLPFLVGGTGLYVKAVLEGWQIPRVSPDPEFRYNIEKKVNERNIDEIYQELVITDPDAAAKIDRRNVRRVIRALEVHAKVGQAFSRLERKIPPPFTPLIIGLTAERSVLYRIVDQRVDSMIERGLVQEVENLLEMGYDFNLPSMSGIGYRQIGLFLKGDLTLPEASQQIKYETHRYARHQYAWFRRSDKRIRWFDIQTPVDAAVTELVNEFLATPGATTRICTRLTEKA